MVHLAELLGDPLVVQVNLFLPVDHDLEEVLEVLLDDLLLVHFDLLIVDFTYSSSSRSRLSRRTE